MIRTYSQKIIAKLQEFQIMAKNSSFSPKTEISLILHARVELIEFTHMVASPQVLTQIKQKRMNQNELESTNQSKNRGEK